MKKTPHLLTFSLASLLLLQEVNGQIFSRGTVNGSSGVPTTNEQLRVTNGLISQYVSGTVGLGGPGDKWIGIGDPFQTVVPPNPNNLLYGYRTQWAQKALIMNLKGASVGTVDLPTEAEFQWGGPDEAQWTGSLNFNYINNFTSNTPQYRVLELTKTGNTISRTGLLGHFRSGTFGNFTTSDQWIGIGQPTNNGLPTGTLLPFYGTRVQWGDQALISCVRNNNGVRVPTVEWGAQNQPLEFRYFSNPANSASSVRIMDLSPDGKVRIGPTFVNAFGGTLSDQLQVYSPTGQSNLALRSESSGGGSNAFFTALGTTTTNIRLGALGNTTSTGTATCIEAQASSAQTTTGIRATGFAGLVNYGIFAEGTGSVSSAVNYSVYGSTSASSVGTQWAGYFAGRVFANQYITSSDASLKENVKNENESLLEKLMLLRPVNYSYKASARQFEGMGLPGGLKHGFIAQELEKVFPELVTEVKQLKKANPEEKNGNKLEFIEFKGIDYSGLIPMLTKALQEEKRLIDKQAEKMKQQDEVIQALAATVKRLEDQITGTRVNTEVVPNSPKVADGGTASLSQNIPNPFKGVTVISYTLPANEKQAALQIRNAAGVLLQSVALTYTTGTVNVNTNGYKPGNYVYSLVVNEKAIISKQMIISE